VESRVTGEWFVSSKGEMAFQGTGGGIYVAEKVASLCTKRRIPVAGWVCSKSSSNALAHGEIHWNKVRADLIPLLSYTGSENFINYIVTRYKEVMV
jgi:hypothetical protein